MVHGFDRTASIQTTSMRDPDSIAAEGVRMVYQSSDLDLGTELPTTRTTTAVSEELSLHRQQPSHRNEHLVRHLRLIVLFKPYPSRTRHRHCRTNSLPRPPPRKRSTSGDEPGSSRRNSKTPQKPQKPRTPKPRRGDEQAGRHRTTM
jgi:hypothetical protein